MVMCVVKWLWCTNYYYYNISAPQHSRPQRGIVLSFSLSLSSCVS